MHRDKTIKQDVQAVHIKGGPAVISICSQSNLPLMLKMMLLPSSTDRLSGQSSTPSQSLLYGFDGSLEVPLRKQMAGLLWRVGQPML